VVRAHYQPPNFSVRAWSKSGAVIELGSHKPYHAEGATPSPAKNFFLRSGLTGKALGPGPRDWRFDSSLRSQPLRSRPTGRMLVFEIRDFGSSPNSAARDYGGEAQMAEQAVDNRPVASSTLAATIDK
jgi:hypothetical protein